MFSVMFSESMWSQVSFSLQSVEIIGFEKAI